MAFLFSKKTLVSALLFLSSSQHVTAQTTFSFLPGAASSSFPACGLTCQQLLEAQSACVPPQAQVSNTNTYISCFCQSSLITGLQSSAAVLCPTCTSASDQQLLSEWYKNYCAGGFSSTLTTTATSTSSTASASTGTTTGTTKTGPSTATATGTSSPSNKGSSSSTSSGSKSWFSTHWQWVLMLIILAIGFTALALGAIWLKKRFDAKQPHLYHGNDRTDDGAPNGTSGNGGIAGPAAAFFAGSLRHLSRSNDNSARASLANSSITNAAGASKFPKMQQQPSMSTTSVSNLRSSGLSNVGSVNTVNHAVNNGHQMWGPNQARDIENIAPVEEPVFRNSMASAAAAAAFGAASRKSGEGIGIATSTNDSRTDLSSIGTGGGRSTPAGGRSTPRNMSRPNFQSASASNLHYAQSQQQQQQNQPLLRQYQSHRELQQQRPMSSSAATPVSQVSPVVPVSPIQQ
jgi:hypothetical protein